MLCRNDDHTGTVASSLFLCGTLYVSTLTGHSPLRAREGDSASPATGAGYASNGWHVNHYLVSFLGRIADAEDGLNLEPMLYQVHSSGLMMGTDLQGQPDIDHTSVLSAFRDLLEQLLHSMRCCMPTPA